jgi:4'-phosphopantetheinyl transferase
MVNIYGVKLLDDLRFLELKGLISAYLPEDSAKKASKFNHAIDAQRQIVGELLVRATICKTFNLDSRAICFSYSEKKKPFLKDRDGIHFNISHSGDWIVCAIAESEVGIDVEKIRKINLNIARRFFSTKEVGHLFKLPEKAQLDYFFDLWTLKESYLKALGTGLTRPLNSFTVSQENGNFRLYEEGKAINVFLHKFAIDNHHKLSACAFDGDFAERMEILFIDDLLRMIE